MSRRLRWLLAPLLLLVALVAVVHNNTSSLWLLQQLPGLTVQGFSGTLAGDWQAEQLLHEDAGQALELRGLKVRWRAACLLRAHLCLDELQVDYLAWRDTSAAEATSEPVQLPHIRLPLSITLGQLRIGELHVQDEQLFSDLSLRARLDRQGLQIEQLSLVRDALKLSAQGLLQLQEDWPLELQVEARLPDLQQRAWRLQGQLSGNLQQRLQLQLDSQGYLDASLQGWMQPLQPKLPLQLELRSKDFKAHTDLPAQLHLQQLQLNMEGNLEEGYRLQGQASLPAEQSAIGVALLGRLDGVGADLTHLRLQAADSAQSVELKGRLDWAQALSGKGRLQWQSFPWERLWPGVEVPVSLQQLQADLAFTQAAYSADWQAQLQGPLGAFSMSSQTRGTPQEVLFEQLQMRAGEGRADGRLQLDLADGVRWKGELQLQALDPGYWLAELPGKLQGLLRGSGSYLSDQLAAEMTIDLQGRLRGQPATIKARVDGAGQIWQAPQLDLRLGDNRINGRLALDRLLNGQLDIQLQNLAQLGPGLAGRADGRMTLAGTLDEPQGQLQLQGNRLQYADLGLQQLNLEASLATGQRGRLQLKASGLVRDKLQLGELQLNASGTPLAHDIGFELRGEPLEISLQARAGVVDAGWVGQLAQGRIEFSGQNWRLQAPMSLNYRAGALQLGSHCWLDAPASLCSQGLQVMPQVKIAYRLREFPMQRLKAYWTEDFEWDAQAQADIDLQLADEGPSGRVDVQVAAGNLRVREDDEWLLLPYDTLRLSSRLLPHSIDSQVQFKAPELGELELQVQLDPARANWPMRGRYNVRDVDVGVLRPFFPLLTELAGTLQGQGELAGSLMAPVASGNLQLRDGRVAGDGLPLTIENLRLDMRLTGQQMSIQGDWQSGEQGRANLQGQLDWSQALQLDLRLSGSRLQLFFEPNIQLQAEPDLQLQLRDQRLSVSGRVDVPSGKITLREIPPQAVRRSPDARILNAGRETAAPIQLAMDVELVVGNDRLTFRGLGLTADVQGRMRVTDNLTSRGELQLRNGRFHAFGQRLTIRRARLLFVGPLDQPHLDIEAVRRAGVVTAGIRVSGRSDRPVTEIFSEPVMSEDQALSYLVLGRPMGGGDNTALTQAAIAIGMASSTPITGPLAERVGVRDLELDSEGVGGRVFSDRLTVRYGIDAMQPDRVLTLRYELTRRLYMEAASGLSSSLDLVYRRDF